jgi:hypothetical protein
MMLQSVSRSVPLSLQVRIWWWRLVILATRLLDRTLRATLPVVLPLWPLWWVPVAASAFGFAFGFGAILILL